MINRQNLEEMIKTIGFELRPIDSLHTAKRFQKYYEAFGAGHFLTQGFEAVNSFVKKFDPSTEIQRSWAESKIYGIEKDYRLARVSKISLFMHGARDGNIVFGDGLENYPDKSIVPKSFDILVANPPYSVNLLQRE